MGARHAGNSGPDPPAGRELNRYLNETPENLIMDALEFNESAELYDAFAQYDREALVVLIGQLVMELSKTGVLDQRAFLARIDGCIIPDAQSDDQVSHRCAELQSYLKSFS